jgi:hypothetical protein
MQKMSRFNTYKTSITRDNNDNARRENASIIPTSHTKALQNKLSHAAPWYRQKAQEKRRLRATKNVLDAKGVLGSLGNKELICSRYKSLLGVVQPSRCHAKAIDMWPFFASSAFAW